MPSWTVVVPTNRPEQFRSFLDEWQDTFHRYGVYLIVVQDLPEHDEGIRADFDHSGLEGELHHQGTATMEYLPHKSDMCRSWGIYRAWRSGSDYVLSLDDDVRPHNDIFRSYEKEFERSFPCSKYFSVGSMTTFTGQMRGFPFKQRENGKVMVQYGGWDGVLDYDAHTQLKGVREHEIFGPWVVPVPKGSPTTCCAMNMAWRREFSREMWQLPLYHQRYNRFGDIWSGLFQKKVLDFTGGVMLINGSASISHKRASNPQVNLRREKPGIPLNERIWDELAGGSFETVTASAYTFFRKHDADYSDYFLKARTEWLGLFDVPA